MWPSPRISLPVFQGETEAEFAECLAFVARCDFRRRTRLYLLGPPRYSGGAHAGPGAAWHCANDATRNCELFWRNPPPLTAAASWSQVLPVLWESTAGSRPGWLGIERPDGQLSARLGARPAPVVEPDHTRIPGITRRRRAARNHFR